MHRRLILPLILVASVGLRMLLAWQGGQLYFGDEGRVQRGAAAYVGLRDGNPGLVANAFSWPEHAGFTLVSTAVTGAQHALAHLGGRQDWSVPENYAATLPLAAMVLGLFSALNVWLVHRIARAAGADEEEANWAALLAAASSSLFYYSRFLLPYDIALSAALAGVWCALGPGRPREFAAGAAAGLAYQFYNGYWFLAPVIGAVLLWSRPDTRARLGAAGRSVLGFGLVATLFLLPGALIGGEKYWLVLASFTRTVRQGLFAEGWSLPWEYLWHAEGLLGLAVILATGAALLGRLRAGTLPPRAWLWPGLAGLVWLLLAAASTGLHLFVVYGRSARALVPWLALAGGFALAHWCARRPRWRAPVAGAIVVAAALNFVPHYRLVFPGEVKATVWQEIGVPKEALTFSGCSYDAPARPVTRPDLALVNAQGLYPLRAELAPPRGEVLLAVTHPVAFAPFQYEGHTPRERRLLRQHDLTVRLIRLADPGAVPDTPPDELRYGAADYQDGYDRRRG